MEHMQVGKSNEDFALLVAQAQAKHDASELLISHEGQPVAGQKHVEDEQTILDLDEEGGRKTAKMLNEAS